MAMIVFLSLFVFPFFLAQMEYLPSQTIPRHGVWDGFLDHGSISSGAAFIFSFPSSHESGGVKIENMAMANQRQSRTWRGG
ncbi:hypothetical protein CC80DRAFT_123753 [Byssothecium circinans]|uniref:Uncharacterized protein n=1 Tax=Byssothecium circinans TaxID=147558 RepID=A0A6A5TPT9_9PLEO|nr:hypothetical protein CC80DRAFT_123753 [Byssothecium circinans]